MSDVDLAIRFFLQLVILLLACRIVGYLGKFLGQTQVVGEMIAGRFGRIVNITSSAGLRGNFGQTNYGAAKAALMGITFTWSIELGKYGITVNALAPSGMTRMVGSIPGMEGKPVPPEMNPDLNGPIVAFLASEKASHVNGQVFGRRGFAYTIFQTPRPVAAMYKEGGFTASEIAANFDAAFAEHLQQIGIPQTKRESK